MIEYCHLGDDLIDLKPAQINSRRRSIVHPVVVVAVVVPGRLLLAIVLLAIRK